MEILETTQVEFDIFKTLHVIEKDTVLSEIFMGNINVSFDVLKSMAKENTLDSEVAERARKIFDEIIVNNNEPLQIYTSYKEEAIEVKTEVPTKDSKSKIKLPKHYGKKRILQDIESAATKTELDRAMLALMV